MINLYSIKTITTITALLALHTALSANPAYRITEDRYVITGRTRQSVLQDMLGSASGREFSRMEAVSAFAEERKKKLDKMRAFKNTTVSLSYGEEQDGIIPVILETAITDGTAFLPIPYMFYNSNEGFLGGIIANAPNISGSLQNLVVMGLYAAPPDEEDRLQWEEPNFMILVNWSGIRINPAIFRITAMTMRMNKKMENLGHLRNKYLALSLTGILTGEIPITETLSSKTSLHYTYSPGYTIDYITDESLLPWGPLDSSARADTGFTINAYHWEDNFRSGWKAEVAGGVEWIDPSLAAVHTSLIGEAEISLFLLLKRRFGPQARIAGFARTGEPVLDAGQKIRGIRNGELRGNAGVFLNTGVQILAARFTALELHVMPCIDAVWVYTDGAETRSHDFGLAAGVEILMFLDTLKSLPIKLGAAFDLRPDEKNGSGKFYEIDFSFALTY